MILDQWALQWGISPEAVNHLRTMIIMSDPTDLKERTGQSEASVQQETRIEATEKGCRLWRNNVGAFFDDRGVPVRYGLCNESKKINKQLKSSDLIGIRPIRIQPHHTGTIIGQFMARETKEGDWVYRGTEREKAQLAFLKLVIGMGGDARFACGRGTI